MKSGIIRVHTTTLKPMLSDDHKQQRLRFITKFLVQSADGVMFHDMMDRVHLDEKWFFLKKTKRRVYLTPTEDLPYISAQSKRHIPKLMFLCAVARPRVDPSNGQMFDGRIGLWPFAKMVPALRGSKHRPAGTLELKPVEVNKETYRAMLVNHVLPAIKSVWPGGREVVIQQDNAKPHISPDDPDFVRAATVDGWSISLDCQPAQSPDFNVLDLGFFHSIQTLQFKKRAKNLDELFSNVCEAFAELSCDTLDATFLTLQKCMECSLNVQGGNNYKLPRLHKDRLRRQGRLPITYFCNEVVYDNACIELSDPLSSNHS